MVDVIKKINETDLSPNQYLLLYALHNKLELKNIDLEAETKQLIAKGQLNDSGGLLSYNITSLELEEKALEACILRYQRVFPPIRLGTANIPARSKMSQLKIKTKIFLNTYQYDWDTIYEATRQYVERAQSERYRYMQNASSFLLDKNGDSTLALECEILQHSEQRHKVENNKEEDYGLI